MSHKSLRKAVVTATALSVGVGGWLFSPTGAYASHGAASGSLTSTNGATKVQVSGGSALSTFDNVTDGAWSADGSRMFYVDQDQGISSLRYNDGENDLYYVAFPPDPTAHVVNHNVTADASGTYVYWSSQAGASSARTIEFASVDTNDTGSVVADAGIDYTHPDAGPTGVLVFQKQADSGGTPTGQADVWGFLSSAQADPTLLVSDASSPSVSPSGAKLAFVRSDGSHAQIYTSDTSGNNVVAVTSDAVNHTNPTWSPDGLTIAFDEGTAVKTAKADGSQAAAPVSTTITGVPAYRPNNKDSVVRLFGQGRFATAIATSQAHWATAGNGSDTRAGAQSVTLSRSDTYADALGGAALAAAKQGPLLMTPTTALDGPTAAEIQRVLGTTNPSSKNVYLLGSTNALSDNVFNAIAALGYNPVRVAGQSRFGTATAIATAINPHPDYILAATGMNFPDALGAGAAAGSYDFPGSLHNAVVVLTNNNVLPAETKTFLDDNPTSLVFGIGSQGLNATSAYNPIDVATAGGFFPPSRYTTSMLTAYAFFGSSATKVGVATSLNWPDALAGGALMATLNGPVLISAPTGLDGSIAGTLSEFSSGIDTAYVFGATSAVPATVANQAGTWISGPAGFTSTENPTSMAGSAHLPNSVHAKTVNEIASGKQHQPGKLKTGLAKAGQY